jgi:hypothetical protein
MAIRVAVTGPVTPSFAAVGIPNAASADPASVLADRASYEGYLIDPPTGSR